MSAFTAYNAHTSDHRIFTYKHSGTGNSVMLYKWVLNFRIQFQHKYSIKQLYKQIDKNSNTPVLYIQLNLLIYEYPFRQAFYQNTLHYHRQFITKTFYQHIHGLSYEYVCGAMFILLLCFLIIVNRQVLQIIR